MIRKIESDNSIEEKCGKMDTALLQDYLEGSIDPFEKIIVEGHLNVCRACRRELSELKLMFWELGNKSNYEVEYPEELNGMSEGLIDRVLGIEEKGIARKVVNNLRQTKKIIEFIPGAKQTPEIMKKASKGLSKGIARGVKKGLKKIVASK